MNGKFTATEVTMKEGKINGSVEIKKSKIGTITVYGLLIANDSEFEKKIIFDSSEIYISNSIVQDIVSINSSENPIGQKIYLKEGSIVKGTIVFNNGKGEVIVSGNSKLSPSQVTGGKITLKGKE
jgi:hypothetical protein